MNDKMMRVEPLDLHALLCAPETELPPHLSRPMELISWSLSHGGLTSASLTTQTIVLSLQREDDKRAFRGSGIPERM